MRRRNYVIIADHCITRVRAVIISPCGSGGKYDGGVKQRDREPLKIKKRCR